jgi:hypothetical protein
VSPFCIWASPLVDGAFNRQLSFLLGESIAHLV